MDFPSRRDAFLLNSDRSPQVPNGFEIMSFPPSTCDGAHATDLRRDAFRLAATVKILDLNRV